MSPVTDADLIALALGQRRKAFGTLLTRKDAGLGFELRPALLVGPLEVDAQ